MWIFQTKTVRKAGGGGTGMAKSFFLFYVSQTQIVSMLLEICYKALFNSMTRSAYNKSENRRLIEKSQRLDGIVEAMKDRGESEEYIAEVWHWVLRVDKTFTEILLHYFSDTWNIDAAGAGSFTESKNQNQEFGQCRNWIGWDDFPVSIVWKLQKLEGELNKGSRRNASDFGCVFSF